MTKNLSVKTVQKRLHKAIAVLHLQLELEEKRHNAAMARIKLYMSRVRSRCLHETVRRYTDLYDPIVYGCVACSMKLREVPKGAKVL